MTPVVIVLLALLGVLFIGIVIGGYVFHWSGLGSPATRKSWATQKDVL
jgi:ABC-type dipeptide/oligopeptide/nickel transport system permease component